MLYIKKFICFILVKQTENTVKQNSLEMPFSDENNADGGTANPGNKSFFKFLNSFFNIKN